MIHLVITCGAGHSPRLERRATHGPFRGCTGVEEETHRWWGVMRVPREVGGGARAMDAVHSRSGAHHREDAKRV